MHILLKHVLHTKTLTTSHRIDALVAQAESPHRAVFRQSVTGAVIVADRNGYFQSETFPVDAQLHFRLLRMGIDFIVGTIAQTWDSLVDRLWEIERNEVAVVLPVSVCAQIHLTVEFRNGLIGGVDARKLSFFKKSVDFHQEFAEAVVPV